MLILVCLQHIEIKCFIFFIKHRNHVLGVMNDTSILACMSKIDVSNVGTFKRSISDTTCYPRYSKN